MTSEKLIEMLGDIDEKYIIEYSEYSQIQKQYIQTYMKRCVIAASIILMIGIIALPIIKESLPHNNPVHGKLEIFPTHQEFISILPEENLLKNFTIADKTTYKYVGEYENVNSNVFSSFSISVFENEKVITTITYELTPTKSAEELAALHSLVPTTLNDITIYYKYNENTECYNAVFMNGTALYHVEHSADEETALFAIIKDILE